MELNNEEDVFMARVQITKCEAEVMDVVWQQQQVTIADVVEAIDRKLAYTTVMTTMGILEQKGIVRRGDKIGRAFTYSATVTREEVQQGKVREIAEQFFGGSIRSLVLSLVRTDSISLADITALQQAAEEAERSR